MTRPLGDMARPSISGGGGSLWAGWDMGQRDDGNVPSPPFDAEHPMKKYRKSKKKKKNGQRSGRRSRNNRNRAGRVAPEATTTISTTTTTTTAEPSSNPVNYQRCLIS